MKPPWKPLYPLLAVLTLLPTACADVQALPTEDASLLTRGDLRALLERLSIDPDIRQLVARTQLAAIKADATDASAFQSLEESLPALIAREARDAKISGSYLLKLAIRESALNPKARAANSSASGLYQYTENTWLCALRELRSEVRLYGTISITRTPKGLCRVTDEGEKRRLLALRFDPRTSTRVAAILSRQDGQTLRSVFGRPPSPTELYVMHFLGTSVGLRLLQAIAIAPSSAADQLDRRAARANRRVFYSGARPRTVSEVFQRLGL